MKFKTKKVPALDAVVSKDKLRPTLQHLHLHIEPGTDGEPVGFLEATDSYRLVRAPVELSKKDKPGLIPVEAFKALRKAHKSTSPAEMICLAKTVQVKTENSTSSWDRPVDNTFPHLSNLIPTEYPAFKFGVNAAFLADLAKALGADNNQVQIEFQEQAAPQTGPSPLRAMKVTVIGGNGNVGVLMPVRVY